MIELKPFNNKMKMQNEKDKNPYFPYNNQFHKESTEKKFKELEEQKSLKLNSKEEVQKIREMHERIAKNSQKEKQETEKAYGSENEKQLTKQKNLKSKEVMDLSLIDDRSLDPPYYRKEQ